MRDRGQKRLVAPRPLPVVVVAAVGRQNDVKGGGAPSAVAVGGREPQGELAPAQGRHVHNGGGATGGGGRGWLWVDRVGFGGVEVVLRA